MIFFVVSFAHEYVNYIATEASTFSVVEVMCTDVNFFFKAVNA